MCPQSSHAGASPIMSPSTSWTVSTEFGTVWVDSPESAFCTGAAGSALLYR